MEKVKLNPILEQISGQVGDLVFRRYGDETIIGQKPDMSGVEASPAQVAARARFREAALYGKMVMADPETKALYSEAAKAKGKPAFSLTVADFFNAPSVDEVDLSAYSGAVGDAIIIMASDDFAVSSVNVALSDGAGSPLESGAAVETPPDSGRWLYSAITSVATGTTVRIAVTASDLPGSVGTAEEEKAV
ncbi:MAG: hypothetical protein HN560_05020 [Anaerolineae bacterium]|mgnify:CR=1 FL=1|jgi:hypothetical protein|nr:hypothetical protein [Anaerolineae bacterium]